MFAALVGNVPAQAAIMHSDATLITYTDFGQNTGRYKTTESANALLQHIRQQEGGVTITYTGGQQTYVMPHGMIDFGSTYHVATCAAISPSAVASCAHYYTFDSSFTNHAYGIGSTHAVQYKGIEMAAGTVGNPRWNSSVFSHTLGNGPTAAAGNGTDHKVMRLSKVITDAPYAELYDTAGKNLSNLTYYHAGSGQMWRSTYNTTTLINESYPNNATSLTGAHAYVIGGIVSGATQYAGSTGFYSRESFSAGGINASDPLTWVSRPGDSGSPLYVWDDASGTYQYIGSNRGEMLSGQVGSAFVTNTAFDKQVVEERYTKRVNMGTVGTVYLNAVNTQGETVTDDEGYSTTKWLGTVTGEGMDAVSFVGLQSGLNTWSDLSGLKDTQNWYAYNQSYVAQKNEDLFFTENLVFKTTAKENSIVLNDTVDLGIGYAEFSGGKFTISSAEGESNLFNHAGYVINAGAEVHLQLTNPSDYMREWRKIGAGDLYIEGSGNNDVLLNLGGSGKTYLNRTDGYAAYNVLVNTGATVVISDTEQIKRDLTFGNRGGTLDMNGNSMDWYTTAEEADSTRAGFSINALTEDALVANYRGSSTLTYKEAGNTTYAGSFADSADSSLKIIYDVAEGTWVLNSIRTNLQHSDSGLQVNNGTVVLRGTNTIHGSGSATGRNSNRYSHEDDWHYADAAMNVTVTDGGTFELGSHARLTGNVTVESGGTYVMREGVRHTKEYVEGGQVLEDTGKYAAYFGHKGDVVLNGGTFAVQFNEGVDSTTAYAGSVTGTGAMTVDAGTDGGTFAFSGTVDAGVSKTLNRGQLQLSGTAAADTANKWLVNAGGVMVQFENAADTLGVIHTDSSGVIGLTGDTTTQLDLSSHSQLGIGALSGTTVQYGAAGTSENLTTLNLGGGGKLVVNYALSGSDTLNVNAGTMRGGEISLQNVATDYRGTVNVQAAGGSVSLTTGTDGALNNATVNVNAGGIYRLTDDQHALGGTVNVNAGGLLQGKDMVLTGTVTLAGAMDYNSFTVSNGGELVMESTGAFDDKYAVTVAAGGKLNLNKTAFTQKVNLTDGGMVSGQSSHVEAEGQVLVTQGTGVLDAGTSMLVKGQIGAKEGAKLVLTGENTTLWTSSINRDGGTLEVQTANLKLGHDVTNGTQTIGGKLLIGADVIINATLDTYNRGKVTHNINELAINGGHTLTIRENENTWAQTWNIAELTGEGNIVWDSGIYWPYQGTSKLRLQGNNSFTGTLEVKQRTGYGSMQHLSLEHDYAAQNITVTLTGDADSNPGMAVDTANARLAGLNGTTNTYVYAGAIMSSAPVYGQSSSNPAPSSTALNTLTITGSGEYEFAGTLQGSETSGLNIVMDGTGTQSFTGTGSVVHDVTALRGSLVFTNKPVIHGDIGVAQGASLKMGSEALSLDAGNTLRVLAGADNTSALLNNNLIINGGTIDFSAYNEGAASLALGEGCTLSAGATPTVTLAFRNCGNIKVDPEQVTYKLMDGNWTAIDSSNITVNDCRYLDVSLDRRESGLFASFSLKDGFEYWMSDDPAKWTPSKDNVVITGMEGFSDVINLKADTSIKNGILDNDTTVVIKSDTGNTLQFTTVEKIAGGDLVIDAGVSAGTFTVSDNTRITGTGSLSVGTLNINADLTTGMGLDVSSISIGEKCSWSLDGSERAFTQDLSLNLVNKLTSMSVWGQAALAVAVDSNAALTSGISGTGTLNKTGSGVLTAKQAFQIGTLNVEAGGFLAEESVEIGTLNVAGGATVTMWNKEANSGVSKVLGTVTLGNGATFESNDRAMIVDEQAALQIGTLVQKGETATFGDTHNSGYYVIDALNSTVDNATLNIVKKAESSKSTVVKLGNESTAGNFKGKIVLKSGTGDSGDDRRSLFLVLGGAQAAAGAVVNLASSDSSTAVLGLGINADNVTIAGLESASGLATRAKVFSGTVNAGIDWGSAAEAPGTVGDAFRTLTIDATTDYVFHGAVLSSLNLVKEGSGKQTLSGTSANFNGSITVNEGTLALGNNAMSMLTQASSVLVNEGGALDFSGVTLSSGMLQPVRGEGTVILSYDVSGNGTGFDFSTFGGKVQLNSGRVLMSSSTFGEEVPEFILTSGNSQLVFNDNGTVVKSDVTLNADTAFYVNSTKDGEISGALSGKGLTKEGAGELLLSGGVELAYLKTKVGTVEISGSGNKLGMADGSMGGSAEGSLRLSKGADLTVAGDIWGRSHSSIVLEEGARLTNTQDGVIFTNKNQDHDAALVNNANDGEYSVGNSDFQLTNGYLKYDSSTAATLTNKLTNSVVENGNAGNAKLTVNNSANTLSGLVASGGSMDVLNQAALSLDILEVATGKSVGLYTGADASSEKAAVVVTGSATFGAGAALNTACLTLADGATLEMTGLETGAVTLNGALTFGNGLKMGENLLASVGALDYGETLNLFTGLSGVNLPVAVDTESSRVLASSVFSNVQSDTLYVDYRVIDNVGTLLVANVPEPATATLSLLALAALAARRRRKA